MRIPLALLAASTISSHALSAHWHFVRMAELGPDGFALSHATIASNGDVAFLRWTGPLVFEEITELSAVIGGIEHTVEADGAALQATFELPYFSLNSNGQVAYTKHDPAFGDRTLRWENGIVTDISALFDKARPYGQPIINNNGVIATTTSNLQTFEVSLELIDVEGVSTRLLGESDGYDLRGYSRRYGLNNAGQVAFSTLNSQIIRASSLADLVILDHGQRPALSPSISDSGLVAWVTTLFDPDPVIQPGVYRSDGATVTPIRPGNFPYSYSPPILSDGSVGFLNAQSSGMDDFVGISNGSGVQFVCFSCAASDLGASVLSTSIPADGAQWMNSVGQIVFEAALSDGTHWLIRGDPVPSACPADLSGDALVDDADFSIFVVAYDTLDCADPAMPAGCPADLNGDGVVDDADFVIFVAAYNELLCP